jgi:hypothetical protein
VEGVFDTVERKVWGDADSDMGVQDRHEYTLMILDHSVESIKKLKYKHLDLNHWDWTPPSNGEIEIEAKIYDPRQITTMQHEESMNVLGLTAVWSTASGMLPSARCIELPAAFKDADDNPKTLDPVPVKGERSGQLDTEVQGSRTHHQVHVYAGQPGAGGAERCAHGSKSHDEAGLGWHRRAVCEQQADPTAMGAVPGADCLQPGRRELDASQTGGKEHGRCVPIPSQGGSFLLGAGGSNRHVLGERALEDARSDEGKASNAECEEGRPAGGRILRDGRFGVSSEIQLRQRGHAPRQTQGESVEAGELQVKEAERWSVIFERRKAAWVQRERASRTATAAQSLTRKLQGRGKARWRAGWGFFQKTLGQQSETPAGAKAPPCWRVASKALHSGTEMGELLIQLSTGGRRASEMRRREASGIMPHKVIEASCGSAACKKEPCISAMRQSKFPDYEIRKERQDDPDLTQMAEAAQRSASAMQTPSASGAGGKRSSGGGSEGAPHKKTGEGGSPFRVHQQSGGDFDEGYDNDSDRAVWRPTRPTPYFPPVNQANAFPYGQVPMMQAQMAAPPMMPTSAPLPNGWLVRPDHSEHPAAPTGTAERAQSRARVKPMKGYFRLFRPKSGNKVTPQHLFALSVRCPILKWFLWPSPNCPLVPVVLGGATRGPAGTSRASVAGAT